MVLRAVTFLAILSIVQGVDLYKWNYTRNGQDWTQIPDLMLLAINNCGGVNQSPIDLKGGVA